MANYTPNTLTGVLAPVNAELEKISNSIADQQDRNPEVGQANQLDADYDANSNRIYNLPEPAGATEPVRLGDVDKIAKDLTNAVVVGDVPTMKATKLKVGDYVITQGYDSSGDGGDGSYLVVSDNLTGLNEPLVNGLYARLQGSGVKTVSVPTQFPTLQEAVDQFTASNKVNPYELVINIEAGHALTRGLEVIGKDLGNVRITSTDAIVTLDPSFQGVQGVSAGELNGEVPDPPLFYGLNATMPILDCLIDMGNKAGTGAGILVVNSRMTIYPLRGVINAGFRGLQQRNGSVFAGKANFSGANGCGIRLHQAAQCSAFEANADNCCKTVDLTLGAVYVSRSSSLEFRDGSAQNSGGVGLLARRSLVTARGVNVSGAALEGLFAESNAIVDAIEVVADNCGRYGVKSSFNSKVSFHSGSAQTNTLTDVSVASAGEVGINDLTTTTNGSKQIQDYDGVSYFNTQTGDGVVISESSESVIDFATTVNGNSTRLADGTQITTMEMDLVYLDGNTLYQTKTFPQQFIDTSYSVSASLPNDTAKWGINSDRFLVNYAGWSTRNVNNLTLVVKGTGFTASSTVNTVLVTCIGRWK